MGADIGAYIEIESPPFTPQEGDVAEQRITFVAKVEVDRNYSLFGLLAGVRGECNAIVPPRGIPKDLSWFVDSEYHLRVGGIGDAPGYCPTKNAEAWVNSGASKWVGDKHTKITNPDWHTPSYLYTDELSEVLSALTKHYRKYGINPCASVRLLRGIIAMMRALTAPGYKPRFVFWFDN